MRFQVALILTFICALTWGSAFAAGHVPTRGIASWYGEAHRGKLMANGRPFNPDKFTAASWFYPLGTRVKVSSEHRARSVIVTITDRGPAKRLVNKGRIIDLGVAAFKRLEAPRHGLTAVRVEILP